MASDVALDVAFASIAAVVTGTTGAASELVSPPDEADVIAAPSERLAVCGRVSPCTLSAVTKPPERGRKPDISSGVVFALIEASVTEDVSVAPELIRLPKVVVAPPETEADCARPVSREEVVTVVLPPCTVKGDGGSPLEMDVAVRLAPANGTN
ncbi:hypothetical protein AA0472_2285 [Acetobacter estunensis NRIC 0472]|nr:hypothetical protein AA0472_2285 [Acetobacter estunensis NRIC 0472]